MIDFVVGAGIFILLAVLLVSFPWITLNKRSRQDELTNTRIVKHRLTELQVEQQQGLLDAEDRVQAEAELKLALLDEIKPKKVLSQPAILAVVVGLLIALTISAAVYFRVNQLTQIEQWQQAIERLPELGKRINDNQDINAEDLQTFALGLRTKLHQEPDNAVGWMLLGRVWGALNQPETAKDAFEKSLKINPDSVGTLLSYAQALILIGGQNEMQRAQRVLARVLEIEPSNINALGTSAIVASELGDNTVALANWRKLLAQLPNSDVNYAAVEEKIRELSQTSQLVDSAEQQTSSAPVSGTRVAITVQLDESLKHKLPKHGVVFVFAQDASGQMRMPAAVVKLPLGEFPLTVELSDSNAMVKNYTLSGLKQAKLVARISLDENVAQAQGELQGEVIVTLQSDQVSFENILINKEIL